MMYRIVAVSESGELSVESDTDIDLVPVTGDSDGLTHEAFWSAHSRLRELRKLHSEDYKSVDVQSKEIYGWKNIKC